MHKDLYNMRKHVIIPDFYVINELFHRYSWI